MLLGNAIPDPTLYGLDVVFPAAMAGLAVGLATGRREIVAGGAGAAIGVVLSLAVGPALGIIAGGLLGPLVGMAIPDRDGPEPVHAESSVPLRPGHMDEAFEELEEVPPDDEAPGEAEGEPEGGAPGSTGDATGPRETP